MSQCACRSALLSSGTGRGIHSEHHPVACPGPQVRVSHIRFSRVRRLRAQGSGVFLHGGDDHFVAAKYGRRRRGDERNFTACVATTELSESFTLRGDRGCADGAKREGRKTVDVVTLGNLCVDIVLNVPYLPPESDVEKLEYMRRLASSPPDESYWEGGGNANVAIAGARLGLDCVTLGHVGTEKFGHFLHCVLDKEGVQSESLQKEDGTVPLWDDDYDGSTLLCWVLVDPQHQHAFCSRYDFNENPSLKEIQKLSASAEACIQRSRALFVNGYVFDELPPSVVLAAMRCAQEAGGGVFFDPGPRVYSFFRKSPQHVSVLEELLDVSDVLLLTDDEAEALTGIPDPRTSATVLLERGKTTKWVVVKMGGNGCLIATSDGIYHAPAFKVEVADTVGCGDSFAAAIMMGYIKQGVMPITSTLVLANAVGAATAMGQGAGRNVASAGKVLELLGSAEEHGTHVNFKEHQQIISAEHTLSGASPVKIPIKEAAQDARELLISALRKSHNNEILVWH